MGIWLKSKVAGGNSLGMVEYVQVPRPTCFVYPGLLSTVNIQVAWIEVRLNCKLY